MRLKLENEISMLKKLIILAGAVVSAAALPAISLADDTGMAGSLHDLRREGRKVCIVDHWHYGSGSGGTKKIAMKDAIGSWSGFTAMEYGSDWANFNKANSRRVSCSNGGGGVNCSLEGRPCR